MEPVCRISTDNDERDKQRSDDFHFPKQWETYRRGVMFVVDLLDPWIGKLNWADAQKKQNEGRLMMREALILGVSRYVGRLIHKIESSTYLY